jgi:hypothetical protein
VARIADIVIDCTHAASLARFWAAALDGYAIAPYDDAELARLKAVGIDDVEDDPTVLVVGPKGSPRLWFQIVREPKTAKNRVHLDLRAADVVQELVRLEGLGATIAASHDNLVVLADPEGNEFCLLRD